MNFLNRLGLYSRNIYPKTLSRAASLTNVKKQNETRMDILGNDMKLIKDSIYRLLTTDHNVLKQVSKYYFSHGGKNVRPLIVLLISKASNMVSSSQKPNVEFNINEPLQKTTSNIDFELGSGNSDLILDNDILPTQRRLAEITELIHTASLLHDDVIDLAQTRRGQPSGNERYGNKMAILAGDFLLARACVGLARLRNVEVVELLATVISNLVEGEFMQLRNSPPQEFKKQLIPTGYKLSDVERSLQFEYYIEKTYLKTASLISLACEAATCLNNGSQEIRHAALSFGRNLGIGFQVN